MSYRGYLDLVCESGPVGPIGTVSGQELLFFLLH
jgi:hypothetical protein